VFDDWASHLDHASLLGAQNDSEGADHGQSKRLRTAARFQVIENGTAAWGSSRERENLRLSWPEIPGRELWRCRNLSFELGAREGRDL
jgi:hypothetical protein